MLTKTHGAKEGRLPFHLMEHLATVFADGNYMHTLAQARGLGSGGYFAGMRDFTVISF